MLLLPFPSPTLQGCRKISRAPAAGLGNWPLTSRNLWIIIWGSSSCRILEIAITVTAARTTACQDGDRAALVFFGSAFTSAFSLSLLLQVQPFKSFSQRKVHLVTSANSSVQGSAKEGSLGCVKRALRPEEARTRDSRNLGTIL